MQNTDKTVDSKGQVLAYPSKTVLVSITDGCPLVLLTRAKLFCQSH